MCRENSEAYKKEFKQSMLHCGVLTRFVRRPCVVFTLQPLLENLHMNIFREIHTLLVRSHVWSSFSPAHAQELGQEDDRRCNEKRQGHRGHVGHTLCSRLGLSTERAAEALKLAAVAAPTPRPGREHFGQSRHAPQTGLGDAACMLLFTDTVHG